MRVSLLLLLRLSAVADRYLGLPNYKRLLLSNHACCQVIFLLKRARNVHSITHPYNQRLKEAVSRDNSLRKQLTFRDATNGFLAKWHLRNKHRNSCHWLVENLLNPISMRHNPNVGSDAPSAGNFEFVPQTSFCGETSGDLAKCRLFCQAVQFISLISPIILRYALRNWTLTKKLFVNNKITARLLLQQISFPTLKN